MGHEEEKDWRQSGPPLIDRHNYGSDVSDPIHNPIKFGSDFGFFEAAGEKIFGGELGEPVIPKDAAAQLHAPPRMAYQSVSISISALTPTAARFPPLSSPSTSSASFPAASSNTVCLFPRLNCSSRFRTVRWTRERRRSWIVGMAPEEEKMTRRSPLDFPIEWERPKPGRRPDIMPQFSPMKTPLPPPMPADPPEEDEEEEEEKREEEEENPEKEDPDKPDK
ncbi:uncharacterized protein LOC127254410 [Andrographis paniculata]|uniref:uncharacterized protein LOC127254410 n=1 Tax=Andrographis paniculata TaxID=175694 RepID=UPI0021E72E0E|nr:uncharacterized protein LOC127254410 [Andrographis paniculata]